MTADDSASRSLRVIVADNEPFTVSLVAGGLQAAGFEVFTASTIAEAWALAEGEDPHALVTDLDFGNGESGATLLRRVHDEFPWIGLVVLTSHRSPLLAVDDPTDIPQSSVYLVKSALRQVGELADAVKLAISGQAISHSEVERDHAAATITSAQAEVLRMLASGASTRALADHRRTTVRAVETMLARLYAALGLENDERSNARVEAVNLWQQGRIVVR